MTDTKRSSLFFLFLRFIISILLIGMFLGGGYAGFNFLLSMRKVPERSVTPKPKITVRVIKIWQSDHQEILSGYGLSRSLQSTVVSSEISGLVRWISPKLEAGQEIDNGEKLVRIEDDDLQEEVAAAEANVKQSEADLESLQVELERVEKNFLISNKELEASQRELDRLRQLEAKGNIPSSELDRQIIVTARLEEEVNNLEQAKRKNKPDKKRVLAKITLNRSILAKAKLALSRAIISAPYSGLIEKRFVQVGARVKPGAHLFKMIEPNRIEVPVSLGASHFNEVKLGAKASLGFYENEESIWEGTVERISPTVNPNDRTFQVYLEIQSQNGDRPIPPGAFMLGAVAGRLHKNVMIIPRAAFIGDKIFVIERMEDNQREGIVKERHPTIKRLLPNIAIIDGGLKPGEEVIVTSVEEVADGSKVRVFTEKTPDFLSTSKSKPKGEDEP